MLLGEQGYKKANMSGEGLETLRWGTDYLLRTIAKAKGSTAKDPQYLLATQVLPLHTVYAHSLSTSLVGMRAACGNPVACAQPLALCLLTLSS
jgi:hypothetical protein